MTALLRARFALFCYRFLVGNAFMRPCCETLSGIHRKIHEAKKAAINTARRAA